MNNKLYVKPVLANPKDLLTSYIDSAIYDHSRGIKFKYSINESYYKASALLGQGSLMSDIATNKSYEEEYLK